MKAVGAIVDGSAEGESKAEAILLRMKTAERAAIHEQAKQELIKSGIQEKLIIKPMLDGMVLSIIQEKV